MGFFLVNREKHYLGEYKGYRVFQVGNMIGNNFYGTFFAARKKRLHTRWRIVKESERKTLGELKKWISEHPLEDKG